MLLWTWATQQAVYANDNVGVHQLVAYSKERDANLDVTIWYPANPGGTPTMLGETLFFEGTPAMRDAPIADGKFPIILLSHGAGLAGNADALSWVAVPLARQGFAVAAPTHPGNTGATRSAESTMKLWLRPADLTETLNTLEKSAFFEDRLDPAQVSALGFSMGGGTVLMMAGARIVPHRLADYCDTDTINPSLCGWLKQSGLDLHKMDFKTADRDNTDKRIRFVMAIDPAPMDVFALDSFTHINTPVDFVNLGQPGKIPLTLDASEFAKTIAHAHYSTIADGSHYSMFAECKAGAAVLAETEEIGDPICSDGGGRSRAEIHMQLINMIIDALHREIEPHH
ncbi:MAG TPA: dienelactone hydrolase [Rhizobium sp.]|nr:dienelactone hydrolase [Rhizobium sp.]